MNRCFALALFLLAALSPTAAQADKRPNIVFIISDDQRWDTLGAAGNTAIHTPVLDRLAREGVYFRQATVHIPQCAPNRATLLTGLPPHRHGYYSNQVQRPDVQTPNGFKKTPLLPGLLRDAGYRTVLVGKWHVKPDPWNCGFSDVRTWLPGGSARYRDVPLAHGNTRGRIVEAGFTNQVFANNAVAFLNSGEAKQKPFFLWLAFTAPHLPMGPNPPRIQKLYANKTEADLLPPGFSKDTPAKGGNWIRYYEAISHLDEQTGRVLDALAAQKLADNTVVVFVGDNGYMMGSRGLNGKVVPYDESVRVPLLVRAPMMTRAAGGGGGPKGASDAPVSSLDLPPTFLRLAGVTPPKEWPGRDLSPLLRGGSSGSGGMGEAVCEWADEDNPKFGAMAYRVVRTPTHKLIRWRPSDRPDELYDLVKDPRETKNLAGEPSARPVRDDLLRRPNAWMDKTDDPDRKWKK